MSFKRNVVSIVVLLVVAAASTALAGEKNAPPSQKIPKGAKVFVAPIEGGYDTYLKDAIAKKKVPVEIVASRDQADYEITGTAELSFKGDSDSELDKSLVFSAFQENKPLIIMRNGQELKLTPNSALTTAHPNMFGAPGATPTGQVQNVPTH